MRRSSAALRAAYDQRGSPNAEGSACGRHHCPCAYDKPCCGRWDARARASADRGVLCDAHLDRCLLWRRRWGCLRNARAVGQRRLRRHNGSDRHRAVERSRWPSRAFGTLTLGYDQQFGGPWVAGVFVDYDFGNRNDHTRPGDLIEITQRDGHAWSIGGRLGILSSPSTLLFVWPRSSPAASWSVASQSSF
jgi:hypothetical protein